MPILTLTAHLDPFCCQQVHDVVKTCTFLLPFSTYAVTQREQSLLNLGQQRNFLSQSASQIQLGVDDNREILTYTRLTFDGRRLLQARPRLLGSTFSVIICSISSSAGLAVTNYDSYSGPSDGIFIWQGEARKLRISLLDDTIT